MGLLGWWIPSKTWPLRHNLGNFDLLFQNEIIHKAKAPILFLGGFLFSVYHPLPCLICLASLVSNRPKTLTTVSLDPYKARIKAWWTNTGPWKLTIQLIYVNDLQHSNEILKFKLRRHYSTWEKRIINPQDPTHRPCHTVGSERDSLPPKRSNVQVQNRPTLPSFSLRRQWPSIFLVALSVTGCHQPLSQHPDRIGSETWEPGGKKKRTKTQNQTWRWPKNGENENGTT